MNMLVYDRDEGCYMYNIDDTSGNRCITQYWPVRFLIRTSGETKFTFNRVTFDLDDNIITNDSS